MPSKIANRFYINVLITLILLTGICLCKHVVAQEKPQVVYKIKVYKKQVQADSLKRMVNLVKIIPGIMLDLRYGTTNNFTRQKLYNQTKNTFLRKPVAEALLKVQQVLNIKGYGLKIFDAYRPYSVTVKMWEPIKDERYVANPAKGSGHNRGIAVDLTIINLKDASELNMGTGFDNFTDSAHLDFKKLSSTVLQNRKLLKETMEKNGFAALETEWWHYSFPGAVNYEVLNIDFKKLQKVKQ
ncbi:MAG: M15 family metallopeptidase [Bacteroidota bacterium]|nr:M15 family metallopeptidase [Bacteroidota bacterium]